MKTIHYLAGLPRSGNTVLSSILNQNPNFYSSPLSPTTDLAWAIVREYSQNSNALRNQNLKTLKNVLKGMQHSLYENIEQPIIFDREKFWATPGNLSLLKESINPNPKIIFTTRNILEILASYIKEDKKNPFIDNLMEEKDFYPRFYLPIDDARCEFIMSQDYQVSKSLTGLSFGMQEKHKDNFHFVDYNNLVNNPKEIMEGIYKFLEIDYFEHDFQNIVKKEVDNHKAVGESKTLHYVRKSLNKISEKPENILSPYILNKYRDATFWIN